ncbi:hypothetical protein [Oceanobacillus jeddahense]|uniref:hypothetical protein n=1 Tax=Oceanobacillus jeddahense TaxID=1462527 RepID=UPI001B7D76D0|nr:hypothetical protein [Oceanobacillus jeddahense]
MQPSVILAGSTRSPYGERFNTLYDGFTAHPILAWFSQLQCVRVKYCLDILRDKAFLVTTLYIQFSKNVSYIDIVSHELMFVYKKNDLSPP